MSFVIDDTVLDRIANHRPAVLISLHKHTDSLAASALMRTKAAFLAWRNQATSLELLDGQNCLLAPEDNLQQLAQLANDVLADDRIRAELALNASISLERLARRARIELSNIELLTE